MSRSYTEATEARWPRRVYVRHNVTFLNKEEAERYHIIMIRRRRAWLSSDLISEQVSWKRAAGPDPASGNPYIT